MEGGVEERSREERKAQEISCEEFFFFFFVFRHKLEQGGMDGVTFKLAFNSFITIKFLLERVIKTLQFVLQ